MNGTPCQRRRSYPTLAARAKAIEVRGELSGMSMITLPPGVRLRGWTLVFGAKGCASQLTLLPHVPCASPAAAAAAKAARSGRTRLPRRANDTPPVSQALAGARPGKRGPGVDAERRARDRLPRVRAPASGRRVRTAKCTVLRVVGLPRRSRASTSRLARRRGRSAAPRTTSRRSPTYGRLPAGALADQLRGHGPAAHANLYPHDAGDGRIGPRREDFEASARAAAARSSAARTSSPTQVVEPSLARPAQP